MDSYRRIDVGDQLPATSAPPENPPDLVWLRIGDLVIDDVYQRSIERTGWQRVRKIAENFDWARFTPLLASPVEGGRFAVIDGQHRAHAALTAGFSQVPAMVVPMSRRQQASAFAWVNGQVTAMSTFHVYKAALAAGERWAVDCEGACADAGCVLMTSNFSTANKRPGQIYAISLVRQSIGKSDRATISEALSALRGSAQGKENSVWSNIILRPWLEVMALNPGLVRTDLAGFLDLHRLDGLARQVDGMRAREEYARVPHAKLMRETLRALIKKHVQDSAK